MNVQGHWATTDDIGVLHTAVKVLHKLGFTTLKDVAYIEDILHTIILIDTFSTTNGCDSRVDEVKLAKILAEKA